MQSTQRPLHDAHGCAGSPLFRSWLRRAPSLLHVLFQVWIVARVLSSDRSLALVLAKVLPHGGTLTSGAGATVPVPEGGTGHQVPRGHHTARDAGGASGQVTGPGTGPAPDASREQVTGLRAAGLPRETHVATREATPTTPHRTPSPGLLYSRGGEQTTLPCRAQENACGLFVARIKASSFLPAAT